MKGKLIKRILFLAGLIASISLTFFLSRYAFFADEISTNSGIVEVEEVQEIQEVKVESETNATILAAVEEAKIYGKDVWYTDYYNQLGEQATFLVMPNGGFLNGEGSVRETGESWNTDVDPDAATLKEIREAIENIDY
ncbi:hypothetical protein IW492_03115 [Enterococcus sp. BWB1-3]|uniref:hypothetical protein n=1 Tax=Enterococcus sp. BWB1-3 TaxID=2787713 RepID=UPI0019239D81|nr:hypothetical protein [Enterococcus sp. BWB1-3]MBL1228223.1 hypothetical protein [Enterococcus sp. BWB1-3]